jgi:uncharacterized protein YkwD
MPFSLPSILLLFGAALLGNCLSSAEPLSEILKLEKEMWALVNKDRAEHGLKPLGLDADLSAVARSHSKDMAKNGFFGHQSPTTGGIEDRYFRAGIAAARMSENVAMHGTIEGAQEGLMKSPGHRKNLLDPEVTLVGIGIFRDPEGQLYITQNFLRPLPEIDLEKAPEEFVAALNGKRKALDLSEVVLDPNLQALCQANAVEMDKLGKLDSTVARKKLGKLKGKLKRYLTYCQFCQDLRTLLASENLTDKDISHVGIGIVRNQKKEGGFGMLWVTVVAAEKR